MPLRPMMPYVILFTGVLIASTASILIRLAQQGGMPSLSIAAGRLALAALILTPIAWSHARRELYTLRRRDIALGLTSGAFLAAHFAAWIGSLAYTSVASSVAIVTTHPIWIGLASVLVFREHLRWDVMSGIATTLIGGLLIALSDGSAATQAQYANPTLGNGMALLGALAVTGYFLIGRNLRQRISLLAYIWLVYTSAAAFLLFVVLALRIPLLGFSPLVYLSIIGLAVGPQLLGHTAFNWALRYLSATFIAVAILGEPVGSALLALALFGEQFAPLQLLGFVVLLTGIYFSMMFERRGQKARQ